MSIRWDEMVTLDDKLASEKERLVAKTNRLRDQMVDSGITVNGITFQTRPGDRENIAGAMQLAAMAKSAGQPYEVQWIAMDNTIHTLTADDVIALGQAVADRKAELIYRARSVKDNVMSATTFDTLPDVEAEMADPT